MNESAAPLRRARKVITTPLSGTARHIWIDVPGQQRLAKTTAQIAEALGATVSASVLIRTALKVFGEHVETIIANARGKGNTVTFDLITLHRDLLAAARGDL